MLLNGLKAAYAGTVPRCLRARWWGGTAKEHEVNQVDQVDNINRATPVNVTLFEAQRRLAAKEQVVNQISQVGDVDSAKAVSVSTSDAAAGITDSVTVGIRLVGIVHLKAIVGASNSY